MEKTLILQEQDAHIQWVNTEREIILHELNILFKKHSEQIFSQNKALKAYSTYIAHITTTSSLEEICTNYTLAKALFEVLE
jgi:hypothetical protein